MICVVVLSLSFCCTMEASVTKTHSSYVKIYLPIIKLILILILIINKRSYECLGLICILNVRGGNVMFAYEACKGKPLWRWFMQITILWLNHLESSKIINIRNRLRIIIGNWAEFCLEVLPCQYI